MAKLLASEIVEIDDEFLDKIQQLLKEREDAKNQVEQLYSVDQIAMYTNRSAQTIRRHIKEGILNATKQSKNWLISATDYDNYINLKDA